MRAIYAFSGDPITNGHLDVALRASRTYSEVVVGIGENPQKSDRYLFSQEERLALARQCLARFSNVSCTVFQGLLAEYAYRNRFDVIIRGIRNNSDLENELVQFAVNESLHPRVDTIFFPTRSSLAHISSSVVKAIVSEGGDVSNFCPLPVKEALEKKILGKFTVGVAGGIAAGKSYFSAKLAESLRRQGLTAANISLDKVGHYVLSNSPESIYRKTRKQIARHFGEEILLPSGAIDRSLLGKLVFSSSRALEELNRIMREPMLAKLYEETRDLPSNVVVVLEGAILIEAHETNLVNNNVILLDAPADLRRQRLMARDGIDKEEADAKITRQITAEERKKQICRQIRQDHWGRLWEVQDSGDKERLAQITREIADLAQGPLSLISTH